MPIRKALLPILSLLFCIAGSSLARAQDPEGWIATYDGGTGSGLERPVGIAVDAEGAVYVAGNTGRGTSAMKYDAEGKLLWSAQTEGGRAAAMALDSSGNLLVANETRVFRYDSVGNETLRARGFGYLWRLRLDANDDLFVISPTGAAGFRTAKYDRVERQWLRTFSVDADGWIESLVLDVGAEGAAHVAATSQVCSPGGCRRAYAALKYDPDGELLWGARAVPVHESFRVAGAALDEDGNLLVAGDVDACDANGLAGFALVKYDPAGNVLWTACHAPAAQGRVLTSAVGCDSHGNVYVTGSSCGAAGCAYTTVKYGPDGTFIWEAELEGGSPAGLAVEPGGAVVVTGTESSCQGQSCESAYMTVKYAPDGTESWVRQLEPPGEGDTLAVAVTLDAAGGVYVVGSAANDYGVVKYDSDGNESWRVFHDTPLEREEAPVRIEVDGDAHAYVAGNSCDPEGCDWVALKYDRTGVVMWESRFEDATAVAMALDESHNVYVTGWSPGSPTRGSQIVTVKYGASGETLWEARTEGIDPRVIGVDFEGNVYIAGGRRGRGGRFVVKYDSDGSEVWAARSAGAGFVTLELDPTGFVYLAEDPAGQGAFVVLLDPDGNEIWRTLFGSVNLLGATLQDLALDASGNVYATGWDWSCNPNCRGAQVTVKYSHEGEEVWSAELADPGLRLGRVGLGVDPDGSVYLGLGPCRGVESSCELITVRYTADGEEEWRRRVAPIGILEDRRVAPRRERIQVDPAGDVYVHDIARATAKYDRAGNELWVMGIPGVVESSLAVSPDRIHLAGRLRQDLVTIEDTGDAFQLEPRRGPAPLTVSVRAAELATPPEAGETTHDWDFGDGGTASGAAVVHTYERAGSYEIELLSSNELVGMRRARRVEVACPAGTVSPWVSTDVGDPPYRGGARIVSGDGSPSLEICSGGRDIFGAEDSFYFVYQELSGNVVLTARVADLSVIERARAGVMLREGLEPGARHASMVLDDTRVNSRFRFLFREEADGRTRSVRGEPTEVPDAWVRIQRQGNEVIGSISADGVEWVEVRRVAMQLPESILVGLAASSRVGPLQPTVDPVSVRFDHLDLDPDPAPLERPFQRGDANADGEVNLTDATVILGALFAGQADAVTCEKAGDTNDSGALEISDSVYLLAHLFGAGAAPGEPFGACGVDPTADSLTCTSHQACE